VMVLGAALSSSWTATGVETWERGIGAHVDAGAVRSMIGAALAPIGAALAIGGLRSVVDLLRPAGRGVALVAAGGFVQWFVGYATYEAGRPLLAQLHSAPGLAADSSLIVESTTFWNVHRALAGVGLFFGSMFFFFTVLFRPTHLPRGAAVLAPFIWLPIVQLTRVLPVGGGVFWFAWADLIWVGFFAGLLWWGRRSQQLE